ncbi:MAG: hypothetical protein NTV94_17050 [Planctomycetota bacterium]|nr:hypothetical protein [Planctomycetota bacterium]
MRMRSTVVGVTMAGFMIGAGSACAQVAGWEPRQFSNLGPGSMVGGMSGTVAQSLFDSGAGELGFTDVATGRVKRARLKDYFQNGDVPTQSQFPALIDSRWPRHFSALEECSVSFEFDDCDDDGRSDDIQLRCIQPSIGSDGLPDWSHTTQSILMVRDVRDGCDYVMIPTATGGRTGAIVYLDAYPADITRTAFKAQRFAITSSGIAAVGSPVVLASVNMSGAQGAICSADMKRRADGSGFLCGTTTHFRVAGGGSTCTGAGACITTVMSTLQIAPGMIRVTSTRTSVEQLPDAPAGAWPIGMRVVMDGTQVRVLMACRGVDAAGVGSLTAYQYVSSMPDVALVDMVKGPRGTMTNVQSNPLYVEKGTRGENPLHTGNNLMSSITMGVTGLIDPQGHEAMAQLIWINPINDPPTISFISSGAGVGACFGCTAVDVADGQNVPGASFAGIGAPMANGAGVTRVGAVYVPDWWHGGCPGDFNQDGGVDGADVDAFFQAWEAGDGTADLNQDGGVDGGDVDAFFGHWEAGC